MISEGFKTYKICFNGLLAVSEIACLSEDQIKDLSNGCGPASMKIKLIPDKIFHIDFREACDLHDCCYHFGATIEDKQVSDRLFLFNLLTIVDNYCNKFKSKFFQYMEYREAAIIYYKAVADWGESAFFEGKENK
jgi:hypothetical protein